MEQEKNFKQIEIENIEDILSLNINKIDLTDWFESDILNFIEYIKFKFQIYFSDTYTNIGIYKIISPSSKVYIGQSINIKNRHEKYKYLSCKDQPALYNAISKYGWENLNITIEENLIDSNNICTGLLNLMEFLYIKYYSKIGESYNLTNGGDSIGKHSSSTIEKLKLSKKSIKIDQYDLDGNFIQTFNSINDTIRQLNIQSRENIQSCLKDEQKTCYGFIFIKHNAKLDLESKINLNFVKVDQYSKEGLFIKTWNTIKEASIELNISKCGISDCLNNRKKSSGGFYWVRHNETFDISKFKKLTGKSNNKIILQLDIKNNLIKEWSSLKNASEELNISRSGISNCLSGKSITSGNYKWSYKN